MPPIKLSRVVYVPATPKDSDPGDPGGLDLGAGVAGPLPAGARHCDIDAAVLGKFLDAISKRNIALDDALERALTLYVNRLQSMTKDA